MRKALINIGRIVQGDDADRNEDIATSFLSDLDYTIRSLNEKKPYYYFKRIEPNDPKYFCTDDKCVNVVCLDKLPDECTKDHVYEDNKLIYHTNDQEYYIDQDMADIYNWDKSGALKIAGELIEKDFTQDEQTTIISFLQSALKDSLDYQ